jgi:hypothetical protein
VFSEQYLWTLGELSRIANVSMAILLAALRLGMFLGNGYEIHSKSKRAINW